MASPTLTTFVFADVEGSTAVLDRLGDGVGVASMLGQLGELSDRVSDYNGRVVKSTGDGLLITFDSPRQAVAFAVAVQQVLAGSVPAVRMGLNTGEAEWNDGDPLGAAVNAAARIAARAGGGEVLVSDVVRQLVTDAPTVAFRDRGRHRLRGFRDRWHLWSVEDRASARRGLGTIGRLAELETIDEVLVATAKRQGRFLLVEGEAGIGKSHLAREVVDRAEQWGVTVIEVAADELVRRAGALAYGLLAASGGRALARERLAAALGPTSRRLGVDLGFAVVEASVELIEDLAKDRPVVVVAEDLHWGDELSVSIFAAIARRCAASQFSLVGTTRPSARPPAVDRLIEACRDGRGEFVRLGPLDPIDVQALASAITGAAPGPSLRQRLDATAGNPLYVRELLRSLDEAMALRVSDGVAEVDPDAPLDGLHETLVRRLSWLPRETTDALRCASLLGSAFTLHDVAIVMGCSVIEVAGRLRDALLAGLIVGHDDRLAFRHDLIREAVYQHMPTAERRDLHRAAGHALAVAGAESRQIAEQFGRGARVGDRESIEWLQRAAADVAPVSPGAASELLDQAIALTPPAWPERLELQARSIDPLVLSARFDDAIARGQLVLAAAPPDASITYLALRGLSAAYGDRGDHLSALDYLQRAAELDGAPSDDAHLLRCAVAQFGLIQGHVTIDEAQHAADEAMAHAGNDVTQRCAALQTVGLVAAVRGYHEVARDHLVEAVTLIESGQVNLAPYVLPGATLSWSLVELDEFDAAIAASLAARDAAERRGAVALLPMCIASTAAALTYAGRWDDALTEIDAAVELCTEIGNPTWGVVAGALRASIAIHRGQLHDAEAHVASAMTQLLESGPTLGADGLIEAQIEVLAARGENQAAVSLARTLWNQTATLRYIIGHRQRAALTVRLAMLAGDVDFACEVTEALEEGARRTPAPSAIGTGLRCRGLLESNPDLLLDAAAHFRATPRTLELADCCNEAANLLAQQDRRPEAIQLLEEAAAIYHEFGAAGDLKRLDDTYAALGVTRRRRHPSRPTFGWDSLTPTEINVAHHVAEGLTNPAIGARLYISRRTVEAHLSSVYRKLDITNRTMLVATMAARASTRPNPAQHR